MRSFSYLISLWEEKGRFRVISVMFLAHYKISAVIDEKSSSEVTPVNASVEVVEIGSKQNYEYKSMQKLCESRALLKSGLYLFSPSKSFPLGIYTHYMLFYIAITSIIGVEEDEDPDAARFGNYGSDDSDAEMMLYESNANSSNSM